MELTEAVQTVRRWVCSCETYEQLNLLPPYINGYLLPMFENDGESYYNLEVAKTDLLNAIEAKTLILSSIKKEIL